MHLLKHFIRPFHILSKRDIAKLQALYYIFGNKNHLDEIEMRLTGLQHFFQCYQPWLISRIAYSIFRETLSDAKLRMALTSWVDITHFVLRTFAKLWLLSMQSKQVSSILRMNLFSVIELHLTEDCFSHVCVFCGDWTQMSCTTF